MMSDFTEEQKIQVTAKIVQDMLSYAVDYLRTTNRYCYSFLRLCMSFFASRTRSTFFPLFCDDFSSLVLFSPRIQLHLCHVLILFLLLIMHFSSFSPCTASSSLSQRWEYMFSCTDTFRRIFERRVLGAFLTFTQSKISITIQSSTRCLSNEM